MKKIAKLVAGGLVALIVGVVGIGWLLPQQHVASKDVLLRAAPSRVFATITDVARYPDWRSNVSDLDIIATDPVRWREHDGSDAITFEVVASEPPQRFQVRIADQDLPFGGTWTYTLTPEGSGTRLRIVEDGEVRNPIFRFVSRFVIGHTASIDRFLADLQRRLS